MGAGVPANTGAARANHRGVCFAGSPAPTGICCVSQMAANRSSR
ncbi:diguanylate cyclase [Pseudomonas monteilii]|uniref:Diguanylate cyclase n=1 Tax=Pseudomonas monteilii TaxID=76759 RepID=A0A2N1IZ00_9PSED|nr:diguanylate cyclase [Pseudomonas monteilii]RPD95648.1 diguanylate cyclase [Pseudomonas monteilii]TFW20319.1 diguanylate cyclase [Pseudomonas putida]